MVQKFALFRKWIKVNLENQIMESEAKWPVFGLLLPNWAKILVFWTKESGHYMAKTWARIGGVRQAQAVVQR